MIKLHNLWITQYTVIVYFSLFSALWISATMSAWLYCFGSSSIESSCEFDVWFGKENEKGVHFRPLPSVARR